MELRGKVTVVTGAAGGIGKALAERFHAEGASVVLEVRPHEAPLWRYWGPRLPDAAVPATALRDAR